MTSYLHCFPRLIKRLNYSMLLFKLVWCAIVFHENALKNICVRCCWWLHAEEWIISRWYSTRCALEDYRTNSSDCTWSITKKINSKNLIHADCLTCRHITMSYSTIGAILTSVGAVCQLIASGFTQQIDVIKVNLILILLLTIYESKFTLQYSRKLAYWNLVFFLQTKKVDSVDEVKNRLERNKNKPQYIRLDVRNI